MSFVKVSFMEFHFVVIVKKLKGCVVQRLLSAGSEACFEIDQVQCVNMISKKQISKSRMNFIRTGHEPIFIQKKLPRFFFLENKLSTISTFMRVFFCVVPSPSSPTIF